MLGRKVSQKLTDVSEERTAHRLNYGGSKKVRNVGKFLRDYTIQHPTRQSCSWLLLFISMGWGYVSELRPATGLFFIPRMIYGFESHDEMIKTGENWKLGEKLVSMPLYLSQIPHELKRALAVRDRRLTAWAITRPSSRFIVYVIPK
jgi:hypothetical protein